MMGVSSTLAAGITTPGAVLSVGVLLGVRHAMDPDHLTAMSSLVLGDRDHSGSRAARMGLAWGVGHALTLVGLGVPVILFGRALPAGAQRWIEFSIGILIAVLALRLLRRWRSGHFHYHPHAHGDTWHAHPHFHTSSTGEGALAAPATDHRHQSHVHRHRSPATSFLIGLIHGAGGSAVAGLLVAASSATWGGALLTLVLFAAMTALAMGAVTAAIGAMLSRGAVSGRLAVLVPPVGVLSLLFGLWYAFHTLRAGGAAL